jgi:hypothetical protein
MGRKKKPSRWTWLSPSRRQFLKNTVPLLAALTTVLVNLRDLVGLGGRVAAPTVPTATKPAMPPAVTHATGSIAAHSVVLNEKVTMTENLHIRVIRKP